MQPSLFRADPGIGRGTPELSLVTPFYNEEEALDGFFERVLPVLQGITASYEIVCVNDGSSDRTLEGLSRWRERDPRVKVVDLSRNFGKEAALSAGLRYAAGAAVVPIDGDLQDPPELLPEMVTKWREGYEVVLGIRSDRNADTVAKRFTAGWFYRIMGWMGEIELPANAGDFRLMDRKVVDALGRLPERTRFMKGLFAWLGFRQARVYYARPRRSAGTSKWRYWKLWNFALDGLVSFTTMPLKIWSYFGFATALVALGYMFFVVFSTLFFGVDVPGYASLISIILFFSGLSMVSQGIMGEYLARVFLETKRRPLYVVRDALGFDDHWTASESLSRELEPGRPNVLANDGGGREP